MKHSRVILLAGLTFLVSLLGAQIVSAVQIEVTNIGGLKLERKSDSAAKAAITQAGQDFTGSHRQIQDFIIVEISRGHRRDRIG